MIASAAIQRYQTVRVTTSPPGELLLMLYDGLFRFLGEAHSACTEGNRARTGERIDRVLAILQELTTGLNPQHAPELCANLEAIYMFCMDHLVEANIHQDPARIENVVRILTPLREGWQTVIKPSSTSQSAEEPPKAGP